MLDKVLSSVLSSGCATRVPKSTRGHVTVDSCPRGGGGGNRSQERGRINHAAVIVLAATRCNEGVGRDVALVVLPSRVRRRCSCCTVKCS